MIRFAVMLWAAATLLESASAETFVFKVYQQALVDDGVLDFLTDYRELDECRLEIADSAILPGARISFQSPDFLGLSCTFSGTGGPYSFNYAGPGSADQMEADIFPNYGEYGVEIDFNFRPGRIYGVTSGADEIQTGAIGFYDSNGDPDRYGSGTSYFAFRISTLNDDPLVALLEPAMVFGEPRPAGAIYRESDVPAGTHLRILNGSFLFEEGSSTPEGDPVNPTVDLGGYISFGTLNEPVPLVAKLIVPTFLDKNTTRKNLHKMQSVVEGIVGDIEADASVVRNVDLEIQRFSGTNLMLEAALTSANVWEAAEGLVKRRLSNAGNGILGPLGILASFGPQELQVTENVTRTIVGVLDNLTADPVGVERLQASIRADLAENRKVVIVGHSTASKLIIAALEGLDPSERTDVRVFLIAATDPVPFDAQFRGYTVERDDDIVRLALGPSWNVDNSQNVILFRVLFFDWLGHSLVPFYLRDGLETRTDGLNGIDPQLRAAIVDLLDQPG